MTNASSVASPMFEGFTVEEYESALALLEQRSYAKGDVILHEGKSEQSLWILVKGTCEVVKKNKQDRTQPRDAGIRIGLRGNVVLSEGPAFGHRAGVDCRQGAADDARKL
jgi:signal-transduction protein with cAMP-binding, CBS, and nucleotidyltransferase domain